MCMTTLGDGHFGEGLPEELFHGPIVDAWIFLTALHCVSFTRSCIMQHIM